MLLKKTLLTLSLTASHLNYSYVTSASDWRFEVDPNNKKQIILFGDCHEEDPIDIEHTDSLQFYCKLWDEEANAKLMIIESKELTFSRIFKFLLKWHFIKLISKKDSTIDAMRVFAFNHLAKGALRFQLSDRRGPLFYHCLELLFINVSKNEYALHNLILDLQTLPKNKTIAQIDEYLSKHPESWKNIEKYRAELKKLSMKSWYSRPNWKQFATVGEIFAELSNTIKTLKKEVELYPDIKTMQRSIQSIEVTFNALKEQFKDVSCNTLFIDWIVDEINNKKSFSFIDELSLSLGPLIVEIGNIGYVIELLKNLSKYQTIIFYVGAYHSEAINEFLAEYTAKFNGSCYQSYPTIIDENYKYEPLSVDILNEFCYECSSNETKGF